MLLLSHGASLRILTKILKDFERSDPGGGFEPSLLWHVRWLNADKGMALLWLRSLPAVQFLRELEAKVPVYEKQEPSLVAILSRIQVQTASCPSAEAL